MAVLTDDLSGDKSLTTFTPHEVDWTADKVDRFWRGYTGGHFFSAEHSRSLAALVKGGPVVDIGCGQGDLVAALDVEAVGVDGSPDLIATARSRFPEARFEVGSVTDLPLDDGTMATALLVEVVEHLDDGTLHAALGEARRVLRPGGTLIVTTPNQEDLTAASVLCPDCGARFHPMQHVRSWTPSALRDTLAAAGFADVDTRTTRLVRDGQGRVVRRALSQLRRQRPHLIATSRRAARHR